MTPPNTQSNALVDRFGRQVDYLRISVTDRCNFRCVYCMAEDMTFMPRAQILTLEEHVEICRAFVSLGVKKIRVTGGEPLVRQNVLHLFQQLGQLPGLKELLITSNGAQLDQYASALRQAGVSRVNISLDSLDQQTFNELTRTGDLDAVLSGIAAAQRAGFKAVKLNAVMMKGRNDHEILDLVKFARDGALDISFIEEMPLGEISEHERAESFCSSDYVKSKIAAVYPLKPVASTTAGPSRYFQMDDSDIKVGFISPHSHNFCGDCNRVRLTAEGRLLLCLGNEHSVDLRKVIRAHPGDRERLRQTITQAMNLKPERHYFDLNQEPQIVRFMNTTGG